jgi:hypothetical protein
VDDFVWASVEKALDDSYQRYISFFSHHELVEVTLSLVVALPLRPETFDLINQRLHESRRRSGGQIDCKGRKGRGNSPQSVGKDDYEAENAENSFFVRFVFFPLRVFVVSVDGKKLKNEKFEIPRSFSGEFDELLMGKGTDGHRSKVKAERRFEIHRLLYFAHYCRSIFLL